MTIDGRRFRRLSAASGNGRGGGKRKMATWTIACLALPVVLPIALPVANSVLNLGLGVVGAVLPF